MSKDAPKRVRSSIVISELIGKQFGRLTIIGPSDRGKSFVEVMCSCGTKKSITTGTVTRGIVRSCGCLNSEMSRARRLTHGESLAPLYKVWRSMISRCENPNVEAYEWYGKVGITVCQRWRNSYEAFRDDMGHPPFKGASIDRIDGSKGYEPGNLKWSTYSEQMRNKRTTNLVTHAGETMCMQDWAEKLGINRDTLDRRIAKGWSIEKALSTPGYGKGARPRKISKTTK